MGKDQTEALARLYLVPGMFHCFGGYGPSQFDMLSPPMGWVESEIPAKTINSFELSNENERTATRTPAVASLPLRRTPIRHRASPNRTEVGARGAVNS